MERSLNSLRTRWAAIGAAIAITLGAGGIGIVDATKSSGERTVLTSITACRITDTRSTVVDPRATPLGARETYTVTAHGTNGQCSNIPTDAVALELNVTATDATEVTFWTFWGDGTRPNASNLNPAPGQPPTPNAVTVDLTTDGKFNLYNEAGTVNAIVDITGYYTDHNHDDRYYTKTESDGRYLSSTPPTSVHISPFAIQPAKAGTAWELSTGWQHIGPTALEECIIAPAELPAGKTVAALNVVYNANAGVPSVDIGVGGLRRGPGSVGPDLIHTVASQTLTPATTPTSIGSLPVGINGSGSPVVKDGFDYLVSVCTKDTFAVIGIDIVLT